MKNYLFNTLKDNKGYTLVEIILASAISFLIAYFAINLTLKVKETNDDLYYNTLVGTDKGIITNIIMKLLKDYENSSTDGLSSFTCNLSKDSTGTKLIFNGNIVDVLNENAHFCKLSCKNDPSNGLISVVVPITLEQFSKKDFNVNINYKYKLPTVEFTFTVMNIKTGKKPGGVNYTFQMKNGEEWVDAGITGTTIANKTFKQTLNTNSTYRVKTEGNGYNLQTSQEFSSGPNDPTDILI